MSNKKQLQANNTGLATALDNINGLPMAEDVKHGKYAWGKYEGRTVDTVPYSITEVEGNPVEFVIYKEISMNNGVTTGIDANTVYIYDIAGGEDITSDEYPYYIYAGIAYADVRISRNATYVQGNEIKAGKGGFIETVVSDIFDKYPDDGERDGHWYKKMKGKMFDNLDFGSFKLAAATANVSIKHSLGVIPTDVYIIPKDRVRSTSSGVYSAVLSKNWLCMDNGWGKAYYGFYAGYTAGAKGVESSGVTVNADTITVSASANFSPECEYYWFAIV